MRTALIQCLQLGIVSCKDRSLSLKGLRVRRLNLHILPNNSLQGGGQSPSSVCALGTKLSPFLNYQYNDVTAKVNLLDTCHFLYCQRVQCHKYYIYISPWLVPESCQAKVNDCALKKCRESVGNCFYQDRQKVTTTMTFEILNHSIFRNSIIIQS